MSKLLPSFQRVTEARVNHFNLFGTITLIVLTDTEFDQVIKAILNAAQKDGIVTPDEWEIIEQVKIDADRYQRALDAALEDGRVTAKEMKVLRDLKQKILDRVYVVAGIDGVITTEERELIDKLAEILSQFV